MPVPDPPIDALSGHSPDESTPQHHPHSPSCGFRHEASRHQQPTERTTAKQSVASPDPGTYTAGSAGDAASCSTLLQVIRFAKPQHEPRKAIVADGQLDADS